MSRRHKSPEQKAIDREIGERMHVRRIAARLSEEQLADAVGVTRQQIRRYERGEATPPSSALKIIDAKIGSLNEEEALFEPSGREQTHLERIRLLAPSLPPQVQEAVSLLISSILTCPRPMTTAVGE